VHQTFGRNLSSSAVPSNFELFKIINKLSSRVDELENCLQNLSIRLNQNLPASSPIELTSVSLPPPQQCTPKQSASHVNQDLLTSSDEWIHVKNGPSPEVTRELIPNYTDRNVYSPLVIEDTDFPAMQASEYVEILEEEINKSVSGQTTGKQKKLNRRPLINYNEAYVENMGPVPRDREAKPHYSDGEITLVVSDSLSRNIRVGHINKLLQQHSDVKSSQETIRVDKFPGATADKIAHCSKFSIENLKPVQLYVIAGTNDISYSNGQIDAEFLAVRILNIGIKAVEMGVKSVCIQGIPLRRGKKYNN